jgi:hypothetical protein
MARPEDKTTRQHYVTSGAAEKEILFGGRTGTATTRKDRAADLQLLKEQGWRTNPA